MPRSRVEYNPWHPNHLLYRVEHFAFLLRALRDAKNYLAEMRSTLQIIQRFAHLVDLKNAVDDRFKTVLGDRLAHGLEHCAGPDEDTSARDGLDQERYRIDGYRAA